MKKWLIFILFILIFGVGFEVKADLTPVQRDNIQNFTISFVKEGLSKLDSNGYPIFAYMQGQARIDGYENKLYYVHQDYQKINTVNAKKWTFDCASFVSYIYKNVFNLTLTGAYRLNPYQVSDFVSDADNNKNFYYVLKNVNINTIDYTKMQPGDLIIIKGSHIMFYLGNEEFAHASSSAITKDKKLGIEFNNLKQKYPDKKFYVIRIKDNIIDKNNNGNLKVTWPDTNTTSDYSKVYDIPTIKTSLSTTNYTKKVVLNVTLEDQDGLASYSISDSNNTNYIKIEGNKASITYEINKNGTYYINVIDTLNKQASKKIIVNNIDNNIPIIKSVIYENEYLIIDALDNESGLHKEAYSLDGKVWYTTNKLKINSNGEYIVYVRDKLNNVSKKSIQVNNYYVPINDKPTINTMISNNNYTKSLFIEINLEDQDGLKYYGISKNNDDNYIDISGNNVIKKYEVFENGTYYIKAVDIYNNLTTKIISINNIDNQAPIITTFVYDRGFLFVDAFDKESALHEKPYSFDGNEWTNVNKLKINGNGTYEVLVRDKLGNISIKTLAVTNYEETKTNDKPLINVSNINTIKQDKINLKINFIDNDGVREYSITTTNKPNYKLVNVKKDYVVDYLITKNGTYYIYVKDVLGNETSQVIKINNIKKEKESVNHIDNKVDNDVIDMEDINQDVFGDTKIINDNLNNIEVINNIIDINEVLSILGVVLGFCILIFIYFNRRKNSF